MAKTFMGPVCKKCRGKERYATNNRCVTCTRKAALIATRKYRARLKGSGTTKPSMPRPDAPMRRRWPFIRAKSGERIYTDPIIHLGLGTAGKFI